MLTPARCRVAVVVQVEKTVVVRISTAHRPTRAHRPNSCGTTNTCADQHVRISSAHPSTETALWTNSNINPVRPSLGIRLYKTRSSFDALSKVRPSSGMLNVRPVTRLKYIGHFTKKRAPNSNTSSCSARGSRLSPHVHNTHDCTTCISMWRRLLASASQIWPLWTNHVVSRAVCRVV